jgi:hypothetical protein
MSRIINYQWVITLDDFINPYTLSVLSPHNESISLLLFPKWKKSPNTRLIRKWQRKLCVPNFSSHKNCKLWNHTMCLYLLYASHNQQKIPFLQLLAFGVSGKHTVRFMTLYIFILLTRAMSMLLLRFPQSTVSSLHKINMLLTMANICTTSFYHLNHLIIPAKTCLCAF